MRACPYKIMRAGRWDDLWLNEGFATWMETGVTNDLHPEWSMWEQFITDMQGRALALDAKRSSHPVQVRARLKHPMILTTVITSFFHER